MVVNLDQVKEETTEGEINIHIFNEFTLKYSTGVTFCVFLRIKGYTVEVIHNYETAQDYKTGHQQRDRIT